MPSKPVCGSVVLLHGLGRTGMSMRVIAAALRRPFDPIIAPLLMPSPNDGKVSVAATRIAGMRDHIVMPVQHGFMVHDAAVIAQIKPYLATGAFSR